jgi:hypothetical protein
MHWRWIEELITYDGTQLRSRWVEERTGLGVDALACFAGPADVPIEHMVDLDDVAANEPIFSTMMLHFIAEHSDGDLALAVARQRLMVSIAHEELVKSTGNCAIERRGDDIYERNRKISVSIATFSPISLLIHTALNIESHGTPLPTKGLADYGIDARPFGETVCRRYCDEIASMDHATKKVRAVE